MKKILSVLFTALIVSSLQANNINWSSPPSVISGANLNASSPKIAVDTNGNSVSIWLENNIVKASKKTLNGNWSSPVNVSGSNASSPFLVMDQNGNSTAIWIEGGLAKASTKTVSGNWTISSTLSNNGATSPSLAVDSSGNVIAAWARNGNIETSTKFFGLSWQLRNTISSSSANNPSIAIGGSGMNTRAVIVWQGTSSGSNAVFSTSKLILGSWSQAQVISEPDYLAAQPFVAVDSSGNALAIWYAYEITGKSYTNVVVKSSERDFSSGNWSHVTSLSEPGLRNPSTLLARITFDSIGNAVALWNTSFDDETFTIESAIKPVNGQWSKPVDLVNSNLYAYFADVSTTSFGDILGLYMFYNGNALMIQSIESDMNGFLNNFWSVPVTISTGTDNAFPKVASSINGNVIYASAVWTNYNGSNTSVLSTTGLKTLILPPSNLSVTQNVNTFGVFNEYYNTLNWNASLDPNVTGYLIFRNGTFVAQVESNVFQYVDNNKAPNTAVTYSVTAVDAQQTQSIPVSVNFQ